MRADVIEEAPVELVDSKSEAVARLVEDFVWGWVDGAFSCNKGVVAEDLEALDLFLHKAIVAMYSQVDH